MSPEWLYVGARAKATRPLHEVYRYGDHRTVERLLHGQWAQAEADDSPRVVTVGDIRARLASGSLIKLDGEAWESEIVPEPVRLRQSQFIARPEDFEHFEAHRDMREVAVFTRTQFEVGGHFWSWLDVSRNAQIGVGGVIWRSNRTSVFENEVAALRAMKEACSEYRQEAGGPSQLAEVAFEVSGDGAHEDIRGLLLHEVCSALHEKRAKEEMERKAELEKLRSLEEKYKGSTVDMGNDEFAKAFAFRRKVRGVKEVLR